MGKRQKLVYYYGMNQEQPHEGVDDQKPQELANVNTRLDKRGREQTTTRQFLSVIPYDVDVAQKLCEMVASGKKIGEALEELGLKPWTKVQWSQNHPDFRRAITQAIEMQTDVLSETLLDTWQEALRSLKGDKSDNARINAYKLKADAIKWYNSKNYAAKYGQNFDHRFSAAEQPVPIFDVRPRVHDVDAHASDAQNGEESKGG